MACRRSGPRTAVFREGLLAQITEVTVNVVVLAGIISASGYEVPSRAMTEVTANVAVAMCAVAMCAVARAAAGWLDRRIDSAVRARAYRRGPIGLGPPA